MLFRSRSRRRYRRVPGPLDRGEWRPGVDLSENFAHKEHCDGLRLALYSPFKKEGRQQAQKSRTASNWLMRHRAKPNLEKTVKAGNTRAPCSKTQHGPMYSSSRSQTGSAQTCRIRVMPIQKTPIKTFQCLSVDNALHYSEREWPCPVSWHHLFHW